MATETSQAPGPSLWLALPAGFIRIDLDEDPGDRMERMAAGLHALFPNALPEQKLSLVLAGETALQSHLREGAVHVSSCLYVAGDGEPIQGTFALFVRPEEIGDLATYPQRAAEQLAAAWPEAEAGVLGLPYGRAAVATRDKAVPVPGAIYGVAEDTATVVRQIELLIPHPSGRHVVAAVFSTEHLEHWSEWLPIVATAMDGISFLPPATDPADEGSSEQWTSVRRAFG